MKQESQAQPRSQKNRNISTSSGKRLYTLKEAAVYLGRSEWGMRELMWKRMIPVVRPDGGRKVFFDILDLDAFIERNKSAYF
jgi:lipoate-protein ligase A